MSVNRMMTRTATILRRVPSGERDRYNNELTELVEDEVRCALQQQSRTEHEDRGEVSDTRWNLFLPYGTLLATGDAVEVDGDRYEVVGEPWIAKEGSRSLWHVAATVQRTSGTGATGS